MSTTVRRGSSDPSLSSAVVIVLIGDTSCVTVEVGKQKPLSVEGGDATFGALVWGAQHVGTPPALHGRGSTRTMHGVRPRSHRSRIVTSTYATVQDLRSGGRVSVRYHPDRPCPDRSRSGIGEADVAVRDIGGQECQEACAFV